MHLAEGLEVLKTLPDSPERADQELRLLTALGPALIATRGYADAEVERAYTRARELCQQGGDTPQLFPVLWALWACYLVRGTLQADLELGEQLLDTAQRAQDPAFLLEAHLALGAILLRLGEVTRSRAHLEQGRSLYRPQQHRSHAFVYGQDPGVACLSDASQALWLLGYPDQALRRNREAMALAQELSHPFSLAFALTFTAWLHHYRQDVQATQEWAEAASTLSTEEGFANWWGLGAIFQGWVMLQHGTGREGMALMRQGLAAWQATGAGVYRPYFLALLAEAAGQRGQPEEGLTIMAEAQRIVQDTGERFLEAELYRLKGQLLLARAGEDQAEASFRHAVNIARRQRAKSLELRSAISLSRLWLRQGRCAKARQLLAGVYAWFTEGFDTADLQEAKILLDELADNRTCTSASRLKVG